MKKFDTYILIGPEPSNNNKNNPGGQLTASIGLKNYAEQNNIHLKIIDTLQTSFPIPSFKVRLISGLNRIQYLFKILLKMKIQGVIIFAGSGFSFYERILASLICKIFNVRTILFIRDGFFKDKVKSSQLYYFLVKIMLKIPDFIGSQGIEWTKFYQSIGLNSQKIVLIRNWMTEQYNDNLIYKKISKDETIRFIFVGWLVKEKGLNELLNSIKDLSQKYNFHFTFVGGGNMEKFVREYAEKNKLKNIELTGWINNFEVKEQLLKAHIFVLPSYSEGFPNALIESMSFGLPSICSNVGAISDSVIDGLNGYLIEPKNENSLKIAMENYILNPEEVFQHSIETINILKEKHDWEKNCKKLFDIF